MLVLRNGQIVVKREYSITPRLLQNISIFSAKACPYRCKQFFDSKNVMLKNELAKLVFFHFDMQSTYSLYQVGLFFFHDSKVDFYVSGFNLGTLLIEIAN